MVLFPPLSPCLQPPNLMVTWCSLPEAAFRNAVVCMPAFLLMYFSKEKKTTTADKKQTVKKICHDSMYQKVPAYLHSTLPIWGFLVRQRAMICWQVRMTAVGNPVSCPTDIWGPIHCTFPLKPGFHLDFPWDKGNFLSLRTGFVWQGQGVWHTSSHNPGLSRGNGQVKIRFCINPSSQDPDSEARLE